MSCFSSCIFVAPQAECHLLPSYSGEGRHLHSWYLQNWTPSTKQLKWINSPSSKRKNMCFDFGMNCPFLRPKQWRFQYTSSCFLKLVGFFFFSWLYSIGQLKSDMRVKWGETERAWNAANSLKSEPNLGSLWRGHCLCTSNTRSINKATREPPRFGGTSKVWNYLSRILARGCLILWFIMCYVIKKIACLQSVLLFVSIIVMRNILWQNAQGCLPDSSRCTYIQISIFIRIWLILPPLYHFSSPRPRTVFAMFRCKAAFPSSFM